MSVKRVDPAEAAELVEQGWTFVDVRSVPEFTEAHPKGAYNVPLLHRGPRGMSPNLEFLQVMQASFAADGKLVLGCRSGGRSFRAAELLLQHGYSDVVDMQGGFDGERTGGQLSCEGWRTRGLPVATQAEAGRNYSDLKD